MFYVEEIIVSNQKNWVLPFKKSFRLFIFSQRTCVQCKSFFKYNKFLVQNEKKNTETRAKHVVKGRELG